jgi:hypothetical protein
MDCDHFELRILGVSEIENELTELASSRSRCGSRLGTEPSHRDENGFKWFRFGSAQTGSVFGSAQQLDVNHNVQHDTRICCYSVKNHAIIGSV